jgi:hypothetical protein
MAWAFETLGNAMVQLFNDGVPVLVTDPWLEGPAYFGSWELERPLTARQIGNAAASPFIWFSHGHPDHFHPASFAYLPRTAKVMVPDHYDDEMNRSLIEHGFTPQILPNKRWVALAPDLRVLCIANENMDIAVEQERLAILRRKQVFPQAGGPICGQLFARAVRVRCGHDQCL